MLETLGRHANDGPWHTVQANRLANDLRVAAELLAPQLVAEDRVAHVGLGVGLPKRATQCWRAAKHGEVLRCDRHAGEQSRAPVRRAELDVMARVKRDALDRRGLPLVLEKVPDGDRELRRRRVGVEDAHQRLRRLVGQRSQDDAFEHEEDERVHGDAGGEHQDGDRPEATIVRQRAKGMTKLRPGSIKHAYAHGRRSCLHALGDQARTEPRVASCRVQ